MNLVRRIGFVGLGMMGAPMAERLARAGHSLFLSDAAPGRAASLASQWEAKLLDEQTVGDLEILITMLPNSAVVETVLLGEVAGAGWSDRLPRGATVIDMSSSEPSRSRALGETLQQRGVKYLDAPVSGGVKRAVDGSLAILVGGEAEELEKQRTLLETLGAKVLHIGAAGAGHAAKALNNYVSAAGLVATVEALRIAERFGIDPAVMTDVLSASSGRSNTSDNKVKQFMLSGTYASGFALHLMTKDLKIARSLAESLGYPMTFGRLCADIWEEAAQRSSPTTDHTEMYLLLAANDE